jgi:hypothetical protein
MGHLQKLIHFITLFLVSTITIPVQFSALRHAVAHKFHLNDYHHKLKEFIESNSDKPYPNFESEKRKTLINVYCDLTLDIAGDIDKIQPRGEWPFPFLSIEINSYRG